MNPDPNWEIMNCQNCDAPVSAADERCPKCGAKLLHRRVFFGAPKTADFSLTGDEPVNDLEELSPEEATALVFPPQVEHAAASLTATPAVAPTAPRYGGFWRRLGAFVIDAALIFLLSVLMALMAYVGYKVGLAAHHRGVSIGNAGPLMLLLTLAGAFLTTAYFVVFHGMDGQTVGKRVFHLRVVGADRQRISYRRALLRWIGTVGLGVASIGLGILWIVWSREKRAWHDFLARTWVVRE
jgi:uncharacterized RDD family membrane protein YckC